MNVKGSTFYGQEREKTEMSETDKAILLLLIIIFCLLYDRK